MSEHTLILIPAIPNLIVEGIHNQFFICYLGSSKNNNQKTGFPIRSGMTPAFFYLVMLNCFAKCHRIVFRYSLFVTLRNFI